MKGDPSKTRFLIEFDAEMQQVLLLCQALSKHIFFLQLESNRQAKQAELTAKRSVRAAAVLPLPTPSKRALVESEPTVRRLRRKDKQAVWDENTVQNWV